MAEVAVLLYVVGFFATATSPMDDPRLLSRPYSISLVSTFLIGAAWPFLAVLTVAGRFWRLIRG